MQILCMYILFYPRNRSTFFICYMIKLYIRTTPNSARAQARESNMVSWTSSLFLLSNYLLLSTSLRSNSAQSGSQPIVEGLSWNFYDSSCPNLESIVRKQLKKVYKKDVGQAAGLLRLHFHDCFVQVICIYIHTHIT